MIIEADYEVNFYINKFTQKSSDNDTSLATLRNRRYKYMLENQESEYFGEEAMKHRDPLLHYNLIGKYEKPGTKRDYLRNRSIPLYEKLIEAEIDRDNKIKRREQIQTNHDEESDSDREADALDDELYASKDTEEIMNQNRKDFFMIMKQRFVDGEDQKHFNYNDIDSDENYQLSEEEQDREDRFFDEI